MHGFELVMSWLIGGALVAAAAMTVYRIVRGPSVLDRVVASDVLVAIIVCTLGVYAALVGGSATLPLLVSLSLVGFMGSVAVARFVARDRDEPLDEGPAWTPDPSGRGTEPVIRLEDEVKDR